MMDRSVFTWGLLVPALAVLTGTSPDTQRGEELVREAVVESSITAVESPDGMSCQFAIRAKNNQSFDVWVDLYESQLNNGGFGVFGGFKDMKAQPERISPGKSMDRRYTASGSCSKKRSWQFYVHIGRPDGKKIYKYVNKSTSGSGDRTINLGNSSTWGL